MADLSSAAGNSSPGPGSPITIESPLQRSPTRSFRRSESRILIGGKSGIEGSTTPLDNPLFDLGSLPSIPRSISSASSIQQQPPPPSPTKSRTLESVTNATPPRYDPDELPSPFIKKMDANRFPNATNSKPSPPLLPGRTVSSTNLTSAAAGGRSRPSMASRLLATRAQAQAGVDEVGRRLSGAGAHLRGRSAG